MFKLQDLKVRRRAWVQVANIPEARRGWLLNDCTEVDKPTMDKVRMWVEAVKNGDVIRNAGNKRCGKGLLLWGEPGHGKTTLSLAVIQEMMTTFSLEEFDTKDGRVLVRPCYFATFNDILALKGKTMEGSASDDEEVVFQGMLGECPNDAYNIRVLIIDDLGKEHTSMSGWQSNMFHHILRTRFNHGLPTIVTTNIKLENWASEYGDATESFANEAFIYLPVTTEDLRK